MTQSKTIFISADHGLAIIYFLQSEVVNRILEKDVRVVVLTDDGLVDKIRERFGKPGLIVEGLRFSECQHYATSHQAGLQWWSNFLRRVGTSNKINTEAMDSHVRQVEAEVGGRQRLFLPFARLLLARLRRSRRLRKWLVRWQMRFNPLLYADLFEKYQPDLVVSSTYGWRNDRYLLREAVSRGVKTGAVIVGWDNPSSYGLPAAQLDFVTCWSEIQKKELVDGSDWKPETVHIGGIPSYDGYFTHEWLIPRDEYYKMHGLDPERMLISYASSFITFSPNYQNIKALVELVTSGVLEAPAQLLIRLHPNHFMEEPLYIAERERIRALANQYEYVHVVEPVALGGNLGYYSGEDMPEKTSMMAHSDIFTTVYSTMCVEAAIHKRPIVSLCIDEPGGWNKEGKFSLALSEIGNWPTHQRFRQAGAGRVAYDQLQLLGALQEYLKNPDLDNSEREAFLRREITFLDGKSGLRTGNILIKLVILADGE